MALTQCLSLFPFLYSEIGNSWDTCGSGMYMRALTLADHQWTKDSLKMCQLWLKPESLQKARMVLLIMWGLTLVLRFFLTTCGESIVPYVLWDRLDLDQRSEKESALFFFFFCKVQIVAILGFVDHMVSFAITKLYRFSIKTGIENMYMNECECALSFMDT